MNALNPCIIIVVVVVEQFLTIIILTHPLTKATGVLMIET